MTGMDSAIAFGKHGEKRTMYARLVGACLGARARALKFDEDATKFEYAQATYPERVKAANEAIGNCTTEREMLLVVKPFVQELNEVLREVEPLEDGEGAKS